MKQFAFCRVCRQNHDKGKGHKYGVKHKQHLVEFLSKARKKIQDIRSSLKEVSRMQDEDRVRNRFWCSFCEQEIDEQSSSFARENAIRHLGSSPHFTNVKNFWLEQGADAAERHRYIISKEDLLKWEEVCKALTTTVESTGGMELSGTINIHSDTSQYKWGPSLDVERRQNVSNVATIDDVKPLSVLTLGSSQGPVPTYDWAGAGATAVGDQPWFTGLRATISNGWHGVTGSGMHGRGPTSCAPRSNFDKEATTSMSSLSDFPQISKEISNIIAGGGQVDYNQVSRGGRVPTDGYYSAQQFVSSLPNATPSQFTVVAAGQDLASVACPPLLPGEGNVHSGATPPWVGPSDDRQLFIADSSMASTVKQPLSRTQERKLAKLRPPNRVGAAWAEMRRAEIEREKRGETQEAGEEVDATWLPNFGRVWQSGSRHDTRKEYEAERRREAKRLGRPLGKRGATSSEKPVQFQAYVSKRRAMKEPDR